GTKYPKIARDFFRKKGYQIDIIKLYGSVELAPLVGLSDGIVDIVSTGKTLKENGLKVYENILDISARLISNVVSRRTKYKSLRDFEEKIREVLNNGD
ncbi:MAG TPA: ATP phosphoribosyltransferase, partial [Candidatus Atribacteria bacterium]|nr:ATP phosphoribosyltransferase [Candidatus Atribacteria bacterium]